MMRRTKRVSTRMILRWKQSRRRDEDGGGEGLPPLSVRPFGALRPVEQHTQASATQEACHASRWANTACMRAYTQRSANQVSNTRSAIGTVLKLFAHHVRESFGRYYWLEMNVSSLGRSFSYRELILDSRCCTIQ